MTAQDSTDTPAGETQQFHLFSADPAYVFVGATISATNKLVDTFCSLWRMGQDFTIVGASGACLVATAIPAVTQATLVAGAGTVEGGVGLVIEGAATVVKPVIKSVGFIKNLFVGTLQATGGTVASVACVTTGAVLAVPAATVASVKVSCGVAAFVTAATAGIFTVAAAPVGYFTDAINYLKKTVAATSVGYATNGIDYFTDTDRNTDVPRFKPTNGDGILEQGTGLTQHCFNQSQSLLTEGWGKVTGIVTGPTTPLFEGAKYFYGQSIDSIRQKNWKDINNKAVVAEVYTNNYSNSLKAGSTRLFNEAKDSIAGLGDDDPNSSLSLFRKHSASFCQNGTKALCQFLASITELTTVPQFLNFDRNNRLGINQDNWSVCVESGEAKSEAQAKSEAEEEGSLGTTIIGTQIDTPNSWWMLDTPNSWGMWFCENAKSPSNNPKHSQVSVFPNYQEVVHEK